MLFSNDRAALRRMYQQAWQRACEGAPLEPLDAQIAQVIREHPEYHALVQDAHTLDRDWTPDHGETNPFLHMSLHLAIREQCATDRPQGIGDVRVQLTDQHASAHEAEHAMLEVLGQALWEAQRAGRAPDEQAYLLALKQLLKGP